LLLDAFISNVYALIFESPVIVELYVVPLSVVIDPVLVPSELSYDTIYELIVSPPSLNGASHDIDAFVLPRVEVGLLGMPGTVDGTTELDSADSVPSPLIFVARILKLYVVPFVNPDIVVVKFSAEIVVAETVEPPEMVLII
jgi:hypothetical protein